jgi:hypothetical protein
MLRRIGHHGGPCDNQDFVVVLQPEEIVVFRNRDAAALRKACTFLRRAIVTTPHFLWAIFDRWRFLKAKGRLKPIQ